MRFSRNVQSYKLWSVSAGHKRGKNRRKIDGQTKIPFFLLERCTNHQGMKHGQRTPRRPDQGKAKLSKIGNGNKHNESVKIRMEILYENIK